MSTYLVVKNGNTTKSYECKTSHSSAPYLKVNTSNYLDLTTNTTTGVQLKVKANGTTYRPLQTTTTISSRSSEYTETTGYSGYVSTTEQYTSNTLCSGSGIANLEWGRQFSTSVVCTSTAAIPRKTTLFTTLNLSSYVYYDNYTASYSCFYTASARKDGESGVVYNQSVSIVTPGAYGYTTGNVKFYATGNFSYVYSTTLISKSRADASGQYKLGSQSATYAGTSASTTRTYTTISSNSTISETLKFNGDQFTVSATGKSYSNATTITSRYYNNLTNLKSASYPFASNLLVSYYKRNINTANSTTVYYLIPDSLEDISCNASVIFDASKSVSLLTNKTITSSLGITTFNTYYATNTRQITYLTSSTSPEYMSSTTALTQTSSRSSQYDTITEV